jgi:hypothetical protein
METKPNNVSRAELYRKVWKTPISRLAAEYDVSGSYLARICTELNVPRPPRGYWEKVKVGQMIDVPPLPELRPGDPTTWVRSYQESPSVNDAEFVSPSPRDAIPPKKRGRAIPAFLLETKEKLLNTESGDDRSILNPRFRKLVDIHVSMVMVESICDLSAALFSRLADYGYQVAFPANQTELFNKVKIKMPEFPSPKDESPYGYGYSRWSPSRCTICYMGTVAIGITFIEMTEEVQTKTYYGTGTKTVPSGRFRIYAYSPYRHSDLSISWQDAKGNLLVRCLDEIVMGMEDLARQIPASVAEGKRKADEEAAKRAEEHRQWVKQRNEEIKKASKVRSLEDLDGIIEEWARIKAKVEFLNELEAAVDATQEENEDIKARLLKAKELLGDLSVVKLIKSWRTPEERYDKDAWKED